MDDSRLYDLFQDLSETGEYDVYGRSADQRIALLQARAIAVLAEQINQGGHQAERLADLIEELIESSPPRWRRIKGWLHAKGWLS